jgi:hypothetical protein
VKIGSVNTGRMGVGARHACLDKQTRPGALRPNPVLVLSVIAGMAHSTLKSGAATQDGVALGYQLKIRKPQTLSGYPTEGRSPVIVKSGSGCGQ